jgi:TolB-like protein
LSSFFEELKRRNVFRVGIAYIIAAWLVMQFADVILNNIEAPPWVFQAILLLLGIGLLFAIFFAWAFELTPEGIKKEKDVDRSTSITPQTGRKLDFIIIAVLVVALGYFAVDKFVLQPALQKELAGVQAGDGESDSSTKSIAVLPFADMSAEKDNEYFTDGLSEELLNILAKIKSLQVAGRTSSFAFKGKNEDLRSIGEKLNVETLLEGSVRKDDVRQKVRVTVQLINVEDGYHIWSESYDRSLEDIFAIQEEIATEVATALKINLLGEAATPATVVRSDLNAYEWYLKGRGSLNQNSVESVSRAVEEFKSAIDLDPGYLPAQLGLAETYLGQAATGVLPYSEAHELAEPLLAGISP